MHACELRALLLLLLHIDITPGPIITSICSLASTNPAQQLPNTGRMTHHNWICISGNSSFRPRLISAFWHPHYILRNTRALILYLWAYEFPDWSRPRSDSKKCTALWLQTHSNVRCCCGCSPAKSPYSEITWASMQAVCPFPRNHPFILGRLASVFCQIIASRQANEFFIRFTLETGQPGR